MKMKIKTQIQIQIQIKWNAKQKENNKTGEKKNRKRENLSWVNEGGWGGRFGWVVEKKGGQVHAYVGGGRSLRCEILLSRNTKYMQIAK